MVSLLLPIIKAAKAPMSSGPIFLPPPCFFRLSASGTPASFYPLAAWPRAIPCGTRHRQSVVRTTNFLCNRRVVPANFWTMRGVSVFLNAIWLYLCNAVTNKSS